MVGLTSTASAQTAPAVFHEVPVHQDSGVLRNLGDDFQVMWSTVVSESDALWMRLFFSEVQLSGESHLRVTSLTDGATQYLDADSVAQWYNTSCYLNGDSVVLELVIAPDGQENRVGIKFAQAGDPRPTNDIESICGTTDDRLPSTDARAGRVWPVGCTGWLINDDHRTFLTAGHCIAFGGSNQVMEFNVPLSDSNGNEQHPPPEDQYSMDSSSVQDMYITIGQDAAYFGCWPNSNTGMTAFMAQGDVYNLASSPPSVSGQDIRITGYGTTSPPVPNEWNLAQKTHTGPYAAFFGSTVQYATDTTGGNSGSAVQNEDTGEAIGIHTHAGCSSGGGANSGTGINYSVLQNYLSNPQGVCAALGHTVPTLTGGQNATLSVNGATNGYDVFFLYSTVGTGTTPASAVGLDLDIRAPKIGGTATVSGGNASLTVNVPSAASGRTVYFQAVQVGRKSDVVIRTIN